MKKRKRIIFMMLVLLATTACWGFPVLALSLTDQAEITLRLEPAADIQIEKTIMGEGWYLERPFRPSNIQGPFNGKPNETRWAEGKFTIVTNTSVNVTFSADSYPKLNGVEFPIDGYIIQMWDPDPGFQLPFQKGVPETISISNYGRVTRWKVFASGTIPGEFWSLPSGIYYGDIQVTISPAQL